MCELNSSVETSSATIKTEARLSPWVNERLAPLQDLLCSRDVERLTLRPRWFLEGLGLIGRFPKKKIFRGRKLGWCRAEVFDWMATRAFDNAATTDVADPFTDLTEPDQLRLPLRCGARPAGLISLRREKCSALPSRIRSRSK